MVQMGYSREKITDSLSKMKYDDITATYLLLGRKAGEVSGYYGNRSNSTSGQEVMHVFVSQMDLASTSLLKPHPSSSSHSPAHLLNQRTSSSSSSRHRRHSDQGTDQNQNQNLEPP